MSETPATGGAMNVPGAGQIQIVEIAVERTYNLGDFQNQKVRCVLSIPPGESPESAYIQAETFLAANHAETPPERSDRLRREREAERQAEEARRQAEEARRQTAEAVPSPALRPAQLYRATVEEAEEI